MLTVIKNKTFIDNVERLWENKHSHTPLVRLDWQTFLKAIHQYKSKALCNHPLKFNLTVTVLGIYPKEIIKYVQKI